ncbi:MAG: transglutaminase domain-containing protein, partial [Candidatus Cryptobacteroides sp.]
MQIRKLLPAIAAALLLVVSCQPSQQDYVNFLYDSMPLPDSLVFPRSYWEENVAKTLQVRERMGWNVPEREFRHFVLPLRVNNEDLDNFRTRYADTLCARVSGMSMEQAALEINHWCHEQATYRPSDARTLGPEATIKCGLGRCGEESVLAVSALRAAGIPARQVYTPRWAHTDDNHAWVEVWVDGKWHFMGACEPEAVLDLAWFNAPVSRAMLLHTKVYGKDYKSDEDVIKRTAVNTEINVIRGYIPARRNTVTVTDMDGKPVEGATVQFKIYNYAEFYTVATYKTDAKGQSSLDTGCGDIVVWATKDGMWGIGVVSSGKGTVVLDKKTGGAYSFDMDIVPPAENPLPDLSTSEQKEINAIRFAREDSIRMSRPHPLVEDPGLYLSSKDLVDVPEEVLEDAFYDRTVTDRYVISPRIERERLMPFRRLIRTAAPQISSPEQAVRWVKDNIRIVDGRNPQLLRIPPAAVWNSRLSDRKSRDIFFVALCRALDMPARVNQVTGKPEYRVGDVWHEVNFDGGRSAVPPTGELELSYNGGVIRHPEYYRHFTISSIGADGLCRLMEYDEWSREVHYVLPVGNYMVTSGMRMSDGSARV